MRSSPGSSSRSGFVQSPTGRDGGSLPILFVAVLLDLIGFGIVLPILPFYARDFGASGLETGLLYSIYSLVQLFMAPIWGRISDRIGRRPVLILGLLGSGIAYLVFARASSLEMLFISRIVGGIGGSTIPVAQAYIADVTPQEGRAGNMGLIGAAFGFGFVIGPMLGAVLSGATPGSPTAPGYTAAAICAANTLLALFFLPESRARQPERRTARFNLGASLRMAARSPRILLILTVYLAMTVAFSTLQPTLSPLADERFGMGPRQAGYLFAFLGVVSALVQGLLVRRVAPRIGERDLLRASALPFALGLLLMGLSSTISGLIAGIVLVAIGYGGTVPSILGLLSRAVEAQRQGATLGLGQSVGSLARVVGTALAGALFDLGVGLPYLAGSLLIVAALLLAGRLQQPASGTA